MSSFATGEPPIPVPDIPPSTEAQKQRSFWMVLGSTLLIAASQTLIKMGTVALGQNVNLLDTAIGILTTPELFAGYALYGVVMVVMVVALRHAELSLIYPVISLSYVWVSIISFTLFSESLNPWKAAGIVVIVSGVGVLGRKRKSASAATNGGGGAR